MNPKPASHHLPTAWRRFRNDTLPDVVCYGLMALALMALHQQGGGASTIATVIAGLGGAFASIYLSFAIQPRRTDGTRHSVCHRLAFLTSALGFALLYGSYGFPQTLPASSWLSTTIAATLILLVSSGLKELNASRSLREHHA